jgi:hypothetical protein
MAFLKVFSDDHTEYLESYDKKCDFVQKQVARFGTVKKKHVHIA